MDNKEALVPFGVSNELLQSLAYAIKNFTEAAASPRNKIAKRSAGGKTVDAGIAAAGKILKEQIKKLMPCLKKTHPDVYNAFIINSKIVDAPGISKAAKAAKATNVEALALSGKVRNFDLLQSVRRLMPMPCQAQYF